MRFATNYMFERSDFLIKIYELFMMSDKWLELYKYQSERDALLLVLAALLRSVTTVLRIVALRRPRRVVFELYKDGNSIRSSGFSEVQASSLFASPSVIYSKILLPEL